MPLAMIDNLIAINPWGPESLSLNLMINSKIEAKKLRCHIPDQKGKSKCHIHVALVNQPSSVKIKSLWIFS